MPSAGRKKPSSPASIAYGPPLAELKQFCCSISPNFSFKMSDISEHYDNEFYYPDDLSDMILLQKLTYFESEEKKSKSLTYVEVHNFIRSQQQANTVKKKQCMT